MFKKESNKQIIFLIIWGLVTLGCAQPQDDEVELASAPVTPSRYMYVASGQCYSGGGNTTFTNLTASNLISRIDLATGLSEMVVADYNASPSQAGDSPVALVDYDDTRFAVLVENSTAGARRIDLVEKAARGNRSTFSNNTTALSAVLRDMVILNNGDFLISKSSAIEKISASNVRITKGANPWVNAPAGPCATATILMSKTLVLSNDFIVFLHAATGQNRIGFVKPAGYGTTGDCSPTQSAPNASAFPVAMAYDSANTRLLVAYAGSATTTDINSIYAYNLTETPTAVTVASSHKIYDSSLYPTTFPYLLYGISEMALDAENNHLYVATAVNTATTVVNYVIEKFDYNPTQVGVANNQVLVKSTKTPFYNYGSDTKCISDIYIPN